MNINKERAVIDIFNPAKGWYDVGNKRFDDIKKELSLKVSNICFHNEDDAESCVCNLRTSFGLPYSLRLFFNREGRGRVEYSIQCPYLIHVLVCIILFSAFFPGNSFGGFLSFAFAFSAMFLLVFYVQARSSLSRFFTDVNEIPSTEINVKEQRKWMKDPNRCPACGNVLSKYQWRCDDCGIEVREKRIINRFSTSVFIGCWNYVHKK